MKHPEPLVPHAPRTAPPPLLCPPLKSLITQHLGKKLEPELPEPAYKPLHVGRKANLLWKHRSMLLDRVQVPLPFEIVCELELKAGAARDHPLYAGTRMTGGPRWNEFYLVQRDLTHLNPALCIPKPKLNRVPVQLIESPYATTTTATLLRVEDMDTMRPAFEYSERQKKRLYRRLFTHIPFTGIISPLEMWTKSEQISKSGWVPQAVTKVLMDVPNDSVIEATLSRNTKKKIRRP